MDRHGYGSCPLSFGCSAARDVLPTSRMGPRPGLGGFLMSEIGHVMSGMLVWPQAKGDDAFGRTLSVYDKVKWPNFDLL